MNKYEIIGIVGEGAYGIVYKAKCKETGEFGKSPGPTHSILKRWIQANLAVNGRNQSVLLSVSVLMGCFFLHFQKSILARGFCPIEFQI